MRFVGKSCFSSIPLDAPHVLFLSLLITDIPFESLSTIQQHGLSQICSETLEKYEEVAQVASRLTQELHVPKKYIHPIAYQEKVVHITLIVHTKIFFEISHQLYKLPFSIVALGNCSSCGNFCQTYAAYGSVFKSLLFNCSE